MADRKRQRTQKTKPRGIDPETGKPYEAIRIPVPERKDIDKLLDRATKGKSSNDPPGGGRGSR